MAYVNFKNSPSEETPLTGGAAGNLNIMQENGTSHGADTKLGYTQSFLNEHIINVSNEVDEDYRVNFIKGKNLYDKATDIVGYVLASNGALNSASGFCVSNYIPVKPNTQYTISRVYDSSTSAEDAMRIGFYTSNKTFIDRPYSSDKPYIITTPSNCYFVRLSYEYTKSNTNVQIEEGSTATTYEPYNRSIYVDNDEIYNQNIMNYITSETRIGTWLGKPLYRKVVQLAPTAVNNWEYLDLNNDIETAINIYGYLKPTNYQQNRYSILNSANDFLIQTTANGKLAIKTSNSAFLTTWYIVLEYTKTTD